MPRQTVRRKVELPLKAQLDERLVMNVRALTKAKTESLCLVIEMLLKYTY